jgi:hypothetical protein
MGFGARSTAPGTGCGGAIDDAPAIPAISGARSTARADEDSDESFTLKSRMKSSKQKADENANVAATFPWWSAEPLRRVSDESSKIAGKKDAGEKRAESENHIVIIFPTKAVGSVSSSLLSCLKRRYMWLVNTATPQTFGTGNFDI